MGAGRPLGTRAPYFNSQDGGVTTYRTLREALIDYFSLPSAGSQAATAVGFNPGRLPTRILLATRKESLSRRWPVVRSEGWTRDLLKRGGSSRGQGPSACRRQVGVHDCSSGAAASLRLWSVANVPSDGRAHRAPWGGQTVLLRPQTGHLWSRPVQDVDLTWAITPEGLAAPRTSSVRATLTTHSCFTACVWSLARRNSWLQSSYLLSEDPASRDEPAGNFCHGHHPFLPHRISYEEMARYADSTTVEQPC